MVPTRSSESNFAKYIFYTEINDINIFIEDTEKGIKKLFVELISKALPEYKIKEVFPLNGRLNVLKKHQEYIKGKYQSNGNNIFIIDGDLYLLNQSIINYKGLFGLNKYCIENYLIDENSIVEFLYYEDSIKSREDIKKLLSFDNWCNENLLLIYLFILYSIAHNQKTGIQTVFYKVKNLIKSNTGVIDRKKTIEKILNIKKEIILKIGKRNYKSLRNQIFNTITFNKKNLLDHISGKDYLMPLLLIKMKQITKFNHKTEILKLRLARECDASYFKKIIDIMI